MTVHIKTFKIKSTCDFIIKQLKNKNVHEDCYNNCKNRTLKIFKFNNKNCKKSTYYLYRLQDKEVAA